MIMMMMMMTDDDDVATFAHQRKTTVYVHVESQMNRMNMLVLVRNAIIIFVRSPFIIKLDGNIFGSAISLSLVLLFVTPRSTFPQNISIALKHSKQTNNMHTVCGIQHTLAFAHTQNGSYEQYRGIQAHSYCRWYEIHEFSAYRNSRLVWEFPLCT